MGVAQARVGSAAGGLNFFRCNKSGSLAKFAAIRRASSLAGRSSTDQGGGKRCGM